MPKRTYQPSKLKKVRRLGFRAKSKSASGRKLIKRRIAKGRARLTI